MRADFSSQGVAIPLSFVAKAEADFYVADYPVTQAHIEAGVRWVNGNLTLNQTGVETIKVFSYSFFDATELILASETARWDGVADRPVELTDGRIPAALDADGDLARNITPARRDSSNLLGRTGGGTFAGELDATRGATWDDDIDGQPGDLAAFDPDRDFDIGSAQLSIVLQGNELQDINARASLNLASGFFNPNMFTQNQSGSPSAVASAPANLFQTGLTGPVVRGNGFTTIYQKGVTKIVAGDTYRVRHEGNVLSFPTDGNDRTFIMALVLNENFNRIGLRINVAVETLPGTGAYQIDGTLLADDVFASHPGAVYLRFGLDLLRSAADGQSEASLLDVVSGLQSRLINDASLSALWQFLGQRPTDEQLLNENQQWRDLLDDDGTRPDNNADVTAASVPFVEVDEGNVTISADFQGTVNAGQLPRTIVVRRTRGGVNVSDDTDWSLTETSGCTATINDGTTISAGNVTITAVTNSGVIRIRSDRDGFIKEETITVTLNKAPPPQTGGGGSSGGASSVNDSSFDTVTATALTTISETMTVQTGSNGQIAFAAPLEVFTLGNTTAGTYDTAIQWRYRPVGGSWSTAGAEVDADPAPTITNTGGEIFFRSGAVTSNPTVTGLNTNTDYEIELQARRTSGPSGSVAFSGTASAQGS